MQMMTVYSRGSWTLVCMPLVIGGIRFCTEVLAVVSDGDSYQEYLKIPCLGSKLDISIFHCKIQPNCKCMNGKGMLLIQICLGFGFCTQWQFN